MSDTDSKLKALAKGVRAISPGFEIKISMSESNPEHYCISVGVFPHAIVIYTDYGLLDTVLSLALSKLSNISQKTLAAINNGDKDK